jgi:hypothetical protein
MIKKSKVIGVRFYPKHVDLLISVCQSRGEDVSDFVRRAVLKELANLSYLDADSKKALGMVCKNGQRNS